MMSRVGMPEAELEAVKEAYKRIYRAKGGDGTSKIAGLLRDFPASKALRRIAESIEAVNNGLNGRSLETARKDNKRAVRTARA
jgi:acyl-[acyl carrier protein]--UDP-N-acetylglucosamine O-acyltransferase